jgi:hypothetical protein
MHAASCLPPAKPHLDHMCVASSIRGIRVLTTVQLLLLLAWLQTWPHCRTGLGLGLSEGQLQRMQLRR